MGRGCAVVLLTFLAASFAARGEEVAQPVPADGKCSVPADKRWTKQEVFVWERVCAGKDADFNKAPGYGGNLDPKKPDAWPESRILRSQFLETILLKDQYRRALTRRGVRIIGARFTETVDLENAALRNKLGLNGSRLERGAPLSRLRSTQVINLSGSKVTGVLDMTGLQTGESLFMRDKAEFAEVNLGGAHVSGYLDLSSSKVTGTLNMGRLRVDQGLIMRDKAEFADVNLADGRVGGLLSLQSSKVTGMLDLNGLQVGSSVHMHDNAEFANVDLTGAHVKGQVALGSSKVTGTLNMGRLRVDSFVFMDGKAEFADVILLGAHVGGLGLSDLKVTGSLNMTELRVDQGLFMRDKAEFAEVNLVGAHVGGPLDLSGSKITGTLNMNELQASGLLYMRQKTELAEVSLIGAHVGGTLDLSGSKVTGTLNMSRLRVDQGLFMRDKAEFAEVNLVGAYVGGPLDLSGSKVIGTLNMSELQGAATVFLSRGAEFMGPIGLVFAKIGELELGGGTFHENVDITGAQIGGELRLGSSQQESAQWPGNPTLILRNTRVDAIQDLSGAWPARLDLIGFTYRSLGGVLAAERDPMSERSTEWFKTWLGKQEHYSPQPYEQLGVVLRNQGRADAADDVLYASKQQERAQAPFLRYLWLTAINWLIGYGYHVEWALIWVGGFLVAGVAALRISGEGRRNGMPYGIAYSFDMLLPIVRLREQHYQIDLHGWPRYYFYVHRIMGYVLAAFFAAGISGLTK